MVGSEKRTAVLLDSYPLWLEAVEHVLGLGFAVVGKATSSHDALALVSAHKPDLLVTDIALAEGEKDGITCFRQARVRHPQLRGVVLSASTDAEDIDAALGAGFAAYVVKSAHPDDLASAIRQAFQHSVYLSNVHGPTQVRATPLVAPGPGLTAREREILLLVAEGYSNAQLAKMLWLAEPTVKFHLSNVYRKLNVSNRTEAARQAQLYGLVEEPGPHLSVA